MKSKFLALTALAALISAPAFAAEHEGWVYNGLTGVGSVSAGGYDGNSFSTNMNIGYRWGVVGLEVGYVSFGQWDDTVSGVKVDLDVSGWSGGVNFNGNIDDKWSVQGRVGAFGWNADGHARSGTTRVSFSDDGNDWYAGASINYNWSERSSIGLGYTYYGIDNDSASLWGLSSEFRF